MAWPSCVSSIVIYFYEVTRHVDKENPQGMSFSELLIFHSMWILILSALAVIEDVTTQRFNYDRYFQCKEYRFYVLFISF